jgi:ribosome-associated heat shock protein Hsp15
MTSFSSDGPGDGDLGQRLDKWLWYARVMKSRTASAELIMAGRVRLNRTRVAKPSQPVRAGDVLTIALRGKVQVLRVLATGLRRGPPAEAKRLYETVGDPGNGTVLGTRAGQAGAGTLSDRLEGRK